MKVTVATISSKPKNYITCTDKQLSTMIEEKKIQKQGLYEVMGTSHTPYVKPYFDIDIKSNETEDFKNLNNESILYDLKKFLKNKLTCENLKFAISTATCETKISYHIIVINYKVKYPDFRLWISQNAKELKDHYIDCSVYGEENQKFRCIFTEKHVPVMKTINGKKQKISELYSPKLIPINYKKTLSNHFISNVDNKQDELILNISKKNEIVETKIKQKEQTEKNVTKEITFQKPKVSSFNISIFNLYKTLFDRCFNKKRFDDYDIWIKIGMAIKNIYGEKGFELYDYASSKGSKYEGSGVTKEKYDSFNEVYEEGITTKTIYWIAKEDNKQEYIKIMQDCEESFYEADFAKKIYELVGNKFIYQKLGDSKYKLYSYNGKYWESGDILLRKYISTELFEYYKDLIVDVYWDSPNFSKYKCQINKLKYMSTKKSIVESYIEYGMNNDIKFDEKWWLFGFNNCVFDIKENKFRDYNPDDYISITTGYDWIEPTIEQLEKLNNIIKTIFPNNEAKKFYLTILSTGLEGRCTEKFFIFNGSGGNGKGLINDLLLIALGDYGFIGNNALLYEKGKTGANPEKANIDKKRLVIFREPPEKNKLENGPIKELTGGGNFSARKNYENETSKKLHCTVICECNKKPNLADNITDAEVRRLVDLLFESIFTDDKTIIDNKNNIYEANAYYKTPEFQEEYKCVLLKILMDAYITYQSNNYKFIVPESVQNRTKQYLEDGCDITSWFKDICEHTKNDKDIIKLQDLYNNFKNSDLFYNMTKQERRKYNYKQFIDFFSSNPFLRRYYRDRYHPTKYIDLKNVLIEFKINDEEDNSNLFENE